MKILILFLSVFISFKFNQNTISPYEYSSSASNNFTNNYATFYSGFNTNCTTISSSLDCKIVDIKCPNENMCFFSIMNGDKKQTFHMGIEQVSDTEIQFKVYKQSTSAGKIKSIEKLLTAIWFFNSEILTAEKSGVNNYHKSGVTNMKDAMDYIFEYLVSIECKRGSKKIKSRKKSKI
ncbi:MAG TPA: hypothetical protein PKD51_17590 [Saprospiraceae bacterium]|nr:hypothetical protein [Saprospiraceae bacterium]HMU04085.1 hypothetical protein [Saprospiraceae bacterium]